LARTGVFSCKHKQIIPKEIFLVVNID
jgi:hypothetical protein